MLVGNAVIVGIPDRDGDNTDVPAELLALLTTEGEYAVLIKIGGDPASSTYANSKVTSVVLPLIGGEPNWYLSLARYGDYFNAAVWAMVLLERWSDSVDTKVVPVEQLPEGLQNASGTATSD